MRTLGSVKVVVAALVVFPGGSNPLGAEELVFADDLEIGSVCAWSSVSPAVLCDEFQTCTEAADEHWACFELPYLAAPAPDEVAGAGDPATVTKADLYVLLDRSGSMVSELSTVRTFLSSVLNNLRCPPAGEGTPGACWVDLWAGGGAFGYAGTSGASYTHHLDSQSFPDFSLLPATEPGGCCNETTLLATWSATTGLGSASSGCTINTPYAARTTCAGSPAANAGEGGIGYPCLRDRALPLFVIVTDEGPVTGAGTLHCPSTTTLVTAVGAIGGKLIGIVGASAELATTTDLQALATSTGAVDSSNSDSPMVYAGGDANAATAIGSALETARTSMRLVDVHAEVVDGDGDAVDVAAFVDHVEVAPEFDAATCAQGLAVSDRDADTFDDTYDSVPGSAVLCWRIVPASNVDLPGGVVARNYAGSLRISTGAVTLQELPLLFLIPPG
jgi:hypothetical protein